MLADREVHRPKQYRPSAKGRADPAENSSKACCLVILLRTPLHHLFFSGEYIVLLLNCQGKNLYNPSFFCVWVGEEKVLSRQGLTAIRTARNS